MRRKYSKIKVNIIEKGTLLQYDILTNIFDILIHCLWSDFFCKIKQFKSILFIDKTLYKIYNLKWIDLMNYIVTNMKINIKDIELYKSYLIYYHNVKIHDKIIKNFRKNNNIGYDAETKQWLFYSPKTTKKNQLKLLTPYKESYFDEFILLLDKRDQCRINFRNYSNLIGATRSINQRKRYNTIQFPKFKKHDSININNKEYKLNLK